MEKEILEQFLGKQIWFLFRENNDCVMSFSGTLLQVTAETILLDFKGETQAYAISGIIKVSIDKRSGSD